MEKKLPKVFANKIEKSLKNNENVYYGKNEEKTIKKDDNSKSLTIYQKINRIFSSSRYVYKADVIITLKDKTITKKIIGRNKKELITMDNEIIEIKDILDIEFKETN